MLGDRAFLPSRLRELLQERLATGALQVQAPARCGKTAALLQFGAASGRATPVLRIHHASHPRTSVAP